MNEQFQKQLLGAHILAVLTVLAGDLLGSALLTTAGFTAAFLTLGTAFLVMTASLVGGVVSRPNSPLVTTWARK